ncbi:MAG: hypothetical protein HOP18_23545 [Deltaproteobacteria bacterium]|nr:hypothetical protein [Deltaproteobacteria bacterium]
MAVWFFLWRCLRVLLVVGVVLALLIIGGVGWVLSGQRYHTFLIEQLSARLHAHVRITGSDLSIAQGLGLELHGVEIQPETATAPVLTAERVAVLLDIWALFRGQLLFHRVEWDKPHITLTESAAGPFAVFQSMLRDEGTATSSDAPSEEWWTPTLALHHVRVMGGEVSYRRKGRAAPFTVTRARALFTFTPEQGVHAQLEGALGTKGELGAIVLRTHLPHWDAAVDMSRIEWTGHVRGDRLVLRELGRVMGREWPVAIVGFDGQVAGQGLVPADLTGTVQVGKAHFGSVHVRSGTMTLKKFLLKKLPPTAGATPTKPVTWMTRLQTASAELAINEVRLTWKESASELRLLTGTGVLRDGDLTLTDFSGEIGSKSRLLVANGTLKQIASAKGAIPDVTVKAELDMQADGANILAALAKAGIADVTAHVRDPRGHMRIEMEARATTPGGALTADGSLQLREVAFAVPTLQSDVRELTGTVIVADNGLLFDTVALKLGQSTVQVSGQVNDYRSTHRKANLDLTAHVDLGELDKLITVGGQVWPTLASTEGKDFSQFATDLQGHADIRLKLLTMKPAETQYDGSLTFQQAALRLPRWNMSVTDLSGQLQLEKGLLSTDELTFLLGTASLRAQGALRDSFTSQRTGEMRVSFTNLPDAEVSALLPPNLIHPQGGTVGGQVDLIFAEDGTLRTKGAVTLQQVQLDPLPKTLRPLTVEEGELSWEGHSGTFVITRGSVTGGTFHGQGQIQSFAPLHIEAALDFPLFDVESIFRLEERPPEPELKPKDHTVVVKVDVTAEQLTYKAMRADQVRASCHWHDRQADIHVAGANAAGGQVQGDAVLWPDVNGLFLVPQLTGVQASQLLTAFGVPSDILTGALNGGGQIYMPDRHQWKSPAHWQAQLSLAIADGVAQRIPILVRLWSAVTLQSVLKLQMPSLPNEGLTFSSLTGDFAIGNGMAVTKNLSLDSSAVRLDANGEINLAERTLNLKTSLSLLHGITSSVAKVPLAGEVLARGADFLTTVPFRVSGPYHDPSVMPLVVDLGSR